MGILNRLFGSRADIAKEIKLDEEKRLRLWEKWEEHLEKNYPERERLSKNFSYADIDTALKDPAKLDNILAQIQELISEEIIDVKSEEKTDSDILSDLKVLTLKKNFEVICSLSATAAREIRKLQPILALFRRIHDLLMVELHAIRVIRSRLKDSSENPENLREMLLQLFQLIYKHEAILYKPLRPGSYHDKSDFREIEKLARCVILEEKFEEKVQTAEEKLIEQMAEIMGRDRLDHPLRDAAVSIYQALVHEAGFPASDEEDFEECTRELNKLVNDDVTLFLIIKGEFPKFTDEKIRQVIKAFRITFHQGYLDGTDDLWT